MLFHEMLPQVKGLQKTTLIDYPGKIACTIFLSGCNFRCGYCYNRDLVCNPNAVLTLPAEELFAFLRQRRHVLEGVCITGGEPTLHGHGLIALCQAIKKIGYLIKLDTNGTNPTLLRELLEEKLVDYIAMDIKNSLERYDKVTGVITPLIPIKESIELIKQSGIEYEFRTTIVPDCIDEGSIRKIGELIRGAKRHSIQQFSPSETAIDPKYASMEPQSKKQLQRYKSIMEHYVSDVALKNVE